MNDSVFDLGGFWSGQFWEWHDVWRPVRKRFQAHKLLQKEGSLVMMPIEWISTPCYRLRLLLSYLLTLITKESLCWNAISLNWGLALDKWPVQSSVQSAFFCGAAYGLCYRQVFYGPCYLWEAGYCEMAENGKRDTGRRLGGVLSATDGRLAEALLYHSNQLPCCLLHCVGRQENMRGPR